MTIQIRDLTVSREIDVHEMSAVRGGELVDAGRPNVADFVALVDAGKLNNPYDLISAAAEVQICVPIPPAPPFSE
jgi:hypothetical protein